MEVKRWITCALDAGVDKCVSELEIAHAEVFRNKSQSIYRSAQPLVESLEREDWDAAKAMFFTLARPGVLAT